MTDIARATLDAIRGIPKNDERRSLLEDLLALRAGESRKEEIYKSQIAIEEKRQLSEFLRHAEEQMKAEALEQERLNEINQKRLQNLKKARRKLKRMRSKE